MSVLFATVIFQVSMTAANPPSNCKSVTHLGVSGCELLPDHTCPTGYHVEAVGPANPQMKAPSRLMCVQDKPSPKKKPVKKPRQAESANPPSP
jgi:hypothetical protein